MSEPTGIPSDYTYYVVEQFVSEVLDFSSQYGSESSISYSAHNIVGKPTKFPSYGDFSQTFVMRDYGPWWGSSPSGAVWRTPYSCPKPHQSRAANFIDVKFEHAVYPFRIHIYETYNPGGLVALWAGDCQGTWKLLWDSSLSPTVQGQVTSQQPRQFSPPIQATDFATKQLRLEFDQSHLQYYTEIDAVCLLGTLDPISPSAKVASMLPKVMPPILSKIVQRKLHILPHPRRVVQECAEQLNRHALNKFIRDHIQRERSPVRDNGCFDLLPREVILDIFSYLDISSLIRVSEVCSTFRDLARDPFLFSVLDLRQVFHCCSSATLAWLLPLSCKLTKLDLSWCGSYGNISPAGLAQFITAVGPQLTHLRLDNCHVATTLVLEAVGTTCCVLTDLSLANCHLLKSPDFQALTQMETLISLNLYRTTINQSCIISLLCNNRSLENISLAACNNINGDEVCLVLSHCQPHLRCLDLWRCSTLTGRGVAALASCSELTDLDLGWCLNVQASSGALVALMEACPNLTRLFLTAHRQTGDRELVAMSHLPKLSQLDILGNRNVSLAAVADLLANVPTLTLLDVSFCEQLGEGNIAQLMLQYSEVSIKWSFTDAV